MAIPKISRPYKFPRIDKKIHNRSVLAAMTNKQSYENGIISDDEIADIQAPDSQGITNTLYAKRIVTEDGEVKVVEMKVRGRQTGESDDDYDDEKYKDDPDFNPNIKRKVGSSIGWDTTTDGLGGAVDEEN